MYVTEVLKYIDELPDGSLNLLIPYFYKFLPLPDELQDPCCQKFAVRESGRYCTSCTSHPIFYAPPKTLEKAVKFLDSGKYNDFILFLDENRLPYPIITEMEMILSFN